MTAGDADDVEASVRDPSRFEAIFDRHHKVVWRYLARLGGRQAADDLAGEVFVRAFARRASFDRERGAVRSWLYGIATNIWRAHARSAARGDAAQRRALVAAGVVDGDDDDVAAAVDAEATYRKVVRAMRLLQPDDQAIVVMYAWERLSYAEIAAVLGVPIGTVRSRLARTRERLRELTAAAGELVIDAEPNDRRPT